jgi:hypothetical protein
MEDFKRIVKMKTGGSVSKAIQAYEKRERKTEEKDDVAQDKKIVKKAFSIHDTQQHEEKTDLKGLKKGGRAKKECGTVKKYKTGGTVENQYGAKKTDKDIKDIANTKKQKPQMLCGGKSVKKYAPGGGVTGGPASAAGQNPMASVDAKLLALEKQRQMEKMKRARALPPSMQGELIAQSPAAAGLSPAAGIGAGLGSMIKKAPAEMPMVDPMGSATGPAMKKGGKAKAKGKC